MLGEDQFCPFTFALLFYLDGNIDSGEKKEAKEGQMVCISVFMV
jgi:hypothetical protein